MEGGAASPVSLTRRASASTAPLAGLASWSPRQRRRAFLVLPLNGLVFHGLRALQGPRSPQRSRSAASGSRAVSGPRPGSHLQVWCPPACPPQGDAENGRDGSGFNADQPVPPRGRPSTSGAALKGRKPALQTCLQPGKVVPISTLPGALSEGAAGSGRGHAQAEAASPWRFEPIGSKARLPSALRPSGPKSSDGQAGVSIGAAAPSRRRATPGCGQ